MEKKIACALLSSKERVLCYGSWDMYVVMVEDSTQKKGFSYNNLKVLHCDNTTFIHIATYIVYPLCTKHI